MANRTVVIESVRVPRFLYGTAWKEDETQRLTEIALRQGFRGIDTANQRRHYHEAAVGQAVAAAIASGLVTRDDLFLQTKFTFRDGQDHRLPYDPKAPIAAQVEQSFASSLEHLGTEVIDSYLLHGPTQRVGLTPADWEAWRAMEAIHDSGRARLLGVSNVTLEQLQSSVSRGAAFDLASCRTAATRPAAGTATSGRSAPRTTSSIRASPCSPPTARCWPTRKWSGSRNATVERSPSGRLPVRPRRRHDPAHRDDQPRTHAGRPRASSISNLSPEEVERIDRLATS